MAMAMAQIFHSEKHYGFTIYVSLGFLMFCKVENSVNLEDVEMADSVGKQASLAGSLRSNL